MPEIKKAWVKYFSNLQQFIDQRIKLLRHSSVMIEKLFLVTCLCTNNAVRSAVTFTVSKSGV